jgi:hypothetical protein
MLDIAIHAVSSLCQSWRRDEDTLKACRLTAGVPNSCGCCRAATTSL